jgi:hypothetical protein
MMYGMRPPSRHNDPTMNQGLDLPNEEYFNPPFFDEDSDSSDGFEIGLQKAG